MTDFSKDAKIFKALSDTKRLTILEYLKSGEKCACVLIENMNIGQSALSYHMKILCDSGIVTARQDGKWTHYSLSKRHQIQKINQTVANKGHRKMAFIKLLHIKKS